MLWASAPFPFCDSAVHKLHSHTVHVHHHINNHTKRAVSTPLLFIVLVFQTTELLIQQTLLCLMKSDRPFRSHLIKTFRQNYSSVCREGGYEEGLKPNLQGSTENLVAFMIIEQYIPMTLDLTESPSPVGLRQVPDLKGCLDPCGCPRGGGRGGMVELYLSPEPWLCSFPQAHAAQGTLCCKELIWIFQKSQKPPRGRVQCLYVEVGVRDILDNAQMLAGREQGALAIDLPRPSGLPDEQNQQMAW